MKDAGFKNYGGRGIRVCDAWRDDFSAFYRDLGPRPSPKHSIDRIDNDGDYCPENCRWATRVEQANNRRHNVIVEYNGEKKTISQWARIKGLKFDTLWNRLSIYHWPVEKALTQKPIPLIPIGNVPAAGKAEVEKGKAPLPPGVYEHPETGERWEAGKRGRMPAFVRDALAAGEDVSAWRVDEQE